MKSDNNWEQVAVCMRWVDDFQPHEDFIGLHKVDSIVTSEIVAVLKDTLLCIT